MVTNHLPKIIHKLPNHLPKAVYRLRSLCFPAQSHSEVTLPKVPDVIDASPIGLTGVSISGYTYSMLDVQFTTDEKQHKACADTSCCRPLVDGDWLAGHPDFSIDTEYS
jgi:hypothetical protein